MLEQRILEKGMELEGLKYYIESFRHGFSPHAGAGIGLERVVFLYLGEYKYIHYSIKFLIDYLILYLFYIDLLYILIQF